MEKTIRVPDLGENIDTVDVVEVAVAEGDRVGRDDTLLTLESDKAATDLPAEVGGRISRLLVKAGDVVRAGDEVAVIEVEGEDGGNDEAGADAAADAGDPAAEDAEAAAGADIPEDDAPEEDASAPEGDSSAASEQPVHCPDLGENIETADVVEIAVAPGDRVEEGDALLTLETDKAATDLPAPAAGEIVSVDVKVGEAIRSGARVATLRTTGGAVKDQGGGTAQRSAPARETASGPAAKPAAPRTPPRAAAPESRPQPPADTGSASARAHASPAVRALARELGVDLAQVTPSGRKQRILKDDLHRFVKQALSSPAGGAKPLPEIDFSQWGEIETTPLSRIRQLTGENLGRSWPQVPQVTQHDQADITDLEAFRKAQQPVAEREGAKLTMVAFLLKACASALRAFPDFNASLSADGKALVHKRYVHIGVAVDTDAGLVVPVLRDVDRKGLIELAAELGEISGRARERRLKPDEMRGGCFTISSLGGIGGTAFTPIVNWPEVAILGASRASMQPQWDGQQFVPRLMLPLSLSYDHRVIDGAAAARFTSHLARLLGDLRTLLL